MTRADGLHAPRQNRRLKTCGQVSLHPVAALENWCCCIQQSRSGFLDGSAHRTSASDRLVLVVQDQNQPDTRGSDRQQRLGGDASPDPSSELPGQPREQHGSVSAAVERDVELDEITEDRQRVRPLLNARPTSLKWWSRVSRSPGATAIASRANGRSSRSTIASICGCPAHIESGTRTNRTSGR